MTDLIVIGNGGHSKVVQDIISTTNYKVIAILDEKIKETNQVNNITYSSLDYLDSINKHDYLYVVAIGTNEIRKKIVDKINLPINNYATLIHKSAVISPSVKIGYGSVIMPSVVINANAVIGNQVIINTKAIIEHDNTIEDYCHVSPGAVLAGTVKVEEATHIGANATILPNVSIGSNSTIGAGAVVTKDLPNNVTAVGVPAKIIKE